MNEEVLCIIKSHALADGHYEEILRMILSTGVDVVAYKVMASPCRPGTEEYQMFEQLFQPLLGSGHYDKVIMGATTPIGSAVILFSGPDAIAKVTAIAGHKDPKLADPNTITGMFGADRINNAISVSANRGGTENQVRIFFPDLKRVEGQSAIRHNEFRL